MSINKEHKIYTAADLKRYHEGTMSAVEMHALESAALEDPFLSDALDGYAYAEDHATDLSRLAEAIQPKEKKDKKVILFNTVWFRVAAMLVLIAGAAYIGFQKGMTKEKNIEVAKNTAPVVLPQTTQPATTLNDTSSSLASNAQQDKARQRSGSTQTDTSIPIEINNDVAVNSRQAEKTLLPGKTTSPVFMEENKDAGTETYKAQAPEQIPFVLRGKVLDNTGSPIPFANISANKGALHFNTDIEGSFSLPVKDSVFMANVSALGYASVNTSMNSNNWQNIIIIPKEQNQLDDVVVSGYGTKSKKAATAAASKISKKDIADRNAAIASERADKYSMPVNGQSAYDQYLADSLRRPVVADAESIKGMVVLSFIVNRNGNPEKIQVVQSLCKSCDEEAIRLLKAGPKWSYTNKKRVTLNVPF